MMAMWLWFACRAADPVPTPMVAAQAVSLRPTDGVERTLGDPAGAPVIVLLHGLGDRPERFQRVIDGYAGPARVLVPGAPVPWHDGGAWFDPPGVDVIPGDQAAEGRAVSDALAAWLLERRRPEDGPVVVAGFSQGGRLAFAMALLHGDQIAGAVPIAGDVPALTASASVRVPVRALHGTADTVLPYRRTQEQVLRLAGLGWDVTLEAFEGVPHTISPEVQAALFRHLDHLTGRTSPMADRGVSTR